MKREALVLLGAVIVGATWCVVVGALVHGDPLLLAELATTAIGTLWAACMISSLWDARRLARELDRYSTCELVDGVKVNVVRGGGMTAFVTGVVRPTIYLGAALVAELNYEERRAVVLHESYHRETFAPLRAAAIEAWIVIAGRVVTIHRLLVERLVDLERMADAHALEHGSSARALAGALLKTDPATLGVAASAQGTGRRVRALLSGEPTGTGLQLAYEWLPIAVAVIAAVGCHALGLALD